jgi:hypothetical protein
MSLDFTQPICTRDGRMARLLATPSRPIGNHHYLYPVRVAIEYPDQGGWFERSYTADGRWSRDGTHSPNDLVNEMPWHLCLRHVTQNRMVGEPRS